MDSNLSLLEIADEDDSLLLQVPKEDPSSIFACSPLQCLISLPLQTEGKEGAVPPPENPSCSPKDDVSKVNINVNKTEAPKLSVEPQQMKRKRKGGSYNLRKSLAWNRAFFTEEGVLDPLELSMISDNHSITDTGLTVIHEEEPDTLVDKTNTMSASPGPRASEEKLSKEMSDSSSIELKKIGACSSPKPDALTRDTRGPPSLAKRKVLAANDINRSRSKRNVCPRPAASSSNDTPKATSKEPKVSRLSVLKSNIPTTPLTARSGALSTSHSNRNQNSHPATNVQKNAQLKGESKIPGSVLSNGKFDLADKRSVTRTSSQQAGKNIDNSVPQMHPLSRSQHQQVNEANKGSNSSGHPPQGVCIAVEKKHQSQFQVAKPSGLRMPSPSLGFFSQPKASGSHNLQQRSSKSCKPAEKNITKSRKAGANSVDETWTARSSLKSSDIVNEAAKKRALKPSLLEVSLQVETNQSPKVDVQCGSVGYEELSKQEKDKKSPEYTNRNSEEQAEPSKSESISNMEDTEFQIDNEKLLSQIDTHIQSEKGTDHHLEDKIHMSNKDMFVFQGPQSIDHCSMLRIPIRKDNLSNIVNNAMIRDKDEQVKPLTCNIQTSDASLVLQGKQDSSSSDIHSGQVKNYNCVKIVNADPSFGDLLGGSLEELPVKNIEQAKGGAGESDEHGQYAQVNFLNGNLSVDCNDTTQNILVAVNQHDMEENSGEKLETPIPSIRRDTLLETDNESDINNCLIHMATLSSQESFELSLPDIKGVCRSESKIAEMEDCQHPGDDQLGSIHRRPVDDGYDQLIDSEMTNDRAQANPLELDKMCEGSFNVSATVCSTEVSTINISLADNQNDMDENRVEQSETPNPSSVGGNLSKDDYESKINTSVVLVTTSSSQGSPEKLLQDVTNACRSESEIVEMEDCQLPGDGQSGFSLELDGKCEASITVAATACRTEVSNASPESGNCCENNVEYPCYTCQPHQVAQANCSSRGNDLSLSNWCTISKLHSREDSTSRDTSTHFDSSSVQNNVQGTSKQEIRLLKSSETTGTLCENKSSVANQCRLPDKSECFEVFADVNSVNEVSIAGVAESSSALFQNKPMVQTFGEFDYPNRVIEELHVEDVNVQSSDEDVSLVAYKCNNPNTSVANDHVSLAADNVNEHSHLIELQKPSLVIADSQHVNNNFHLNRDLLPANNACSEEIKKESLSDGALEPCSEYINASETNTSNRHIQATTETEDGSPYVNGKSELLQMDGAGKDSAEMLPLVEVEFSNSIAAEIVSSFKESEDQIVEVVDRKPDEHCSLSESSEFQVVDNLISNRRSLQCGEVGLMKSRSMSEEAEPSIFGKVEFSNAEIQHQIKKDDYLAGDCSKIQHLNKSEIKSKQDLPTVKTPPNAAPFSDEWLAAMEAAGEEILTMKGGAVQNSPPDKPHHEPGPWSPVRRKNQAIGPHDCTKHTNIPHPHPNCS